MYKEMSQRVLDFNDKAGVVDFKPFSKKWWSAVELQSKLLVEESTEAYAAAMGVDKQELLDGLVDNLVIAFKFADMLEKAGYDVKGAFDAICDNNDSKVFSSYYEAVEAKEKLEERDDQEYSIETAICNGMPFYSVRNYYGKISKPVNFKGVDLKPFIPRS